MEDALAAAARQLGGGLQVKSAQRVRRGGVLGFFAKEHYQVIAEAAPPAEPLPVAPAASPAPEPASALSFDRALQALVEEVEAREVAPLPTPRVRFTDADLAQLPDAEPTPIVDAATVATPEPVIDAVVHPPAAEPVDNTVVAAAPERPLRARSRELAAPDATIDLRAPEAPEAPTFYDFEVLDAIEVPRAPKWTRTALRELGLPAPVLKALPQRTPTSDMAWTQALERAIATVVPAPAPLDEAHDAQVSGFGPSGAVNIVRACANGFTPGLLVIDGRSVPATAAELALGVRECLRQ